MLPNHTQSDLVSLGTEAHGPSHRALGTDDDLKPVTIKCFVLKKEHKDKSKQNRDHANLSSPGK